MNTTIKNVKQQAIIERDLSVLWHPCTQMKDHEENLPLIPIRKASGIWLEDFNGKRYLDAISSWWVNLFGHANPKINQALKHQLDTLEHVIFAGYTHEPALLLAEKLVSITPQGLQRCFYADNGSAGIEVAIKMSFHYWKNRGKLKKTKFITLENSYHGETLGALAMGNVTLYKETYQPLLMEAITAPSPDCFNREENESCEDYALRKIEDMKQILEQRHEEICAIIIEPLVQCAGFMRMYHPIYLEKLSALCKQFEVHLIADEIAVGFGRTGTMFACEQAGISPDFLCLSKGLTGGYLPLCAVLSTEEIYQAFYDDYNNLTAFLHSHSYTGNPLACRAALTTLDIFSEENVLENNRFLAKKMFQVVEHLQEHSNVAEIRQTGMILAIEMIKDKKHKIPFDWRERRGLKVYNKALKHSVLLRPLGNVIYFMPPYIITGEQLEFLGKVTTQALETAVN